MRQLPLEIVRLTWIDNDARGHTSELHKAILPCRVRSVFADRAFGRKAVEGISKTHERTYLRRKFLIEELFQRESKDVVTVSCFRFELAGIAPELGGCASRKWPFVVGECP